VLSVGKVLIAGRLGMTQVGFSACTSGGPSNHFIAHNRLSVLTLQRIATLVTQEIDSNYRSDAFISQ